ncbi:amidohydrolase [Bacillus oleivorans]|uniref:Amidohydrolase n=1 Tax=Bacillus oleivorans TaxID=1448271 RepID=A0A285CQE6_9BACI|nr:amidohydrolase [Bacillus oleivorans]SNX69779.1 amidohydrolase [Bacillus oleivorans]
MISMEMMNKLEQKESRIIEIRRYLHAHPELSFEETETAHYIEEFYKNVNIDKIDTHIGGQNGVVVTIKGVKPGKTIALRADFDALPIEEETGLPFASKNPGVMHGCGHDGHTAYMLILAETLAEMKDELEGTIKIIHQPAEEKSPGGAQGIIKAGVLEDVDVILGIHVMSTMETGKIYYHAGNTQTGRADFTLRIQGKGGHGSSPHLSNDAIVAGSSFVMNLQTIVSRRINPFDTAVVTIGSFDGRGVNNVIKDAVTLEGNVRFMSDETKDIVEKEVRRLASGLDETFAVTTELKYSNDYPVLYNDPAVTEHVSQVLKQMDIKEVNEVAETTPQPPSEDFAFYLQEIPGCFFYVGAMPDKGQFYPHHNPKFDINEKSLLISAKAMAAVVLSYCGKSV